MLNWCAPPALRRPVLQSTIPASALLPPSAVPNLCDSIAACSPSGSQCQPGRFLATPSLCALCPAGNGCPGAAAAPAPCRAGSVASQAGAAECTLCPEGAYQAAAGHSACDACPEFAYAHFPGSTG